MMRYVVLLLLTNFLSACVASPKPISRQQVIDLALKSVISSEPEVSGALITPGNVQAERMTLGQAEQRIPTKGSLPAGYTPDTPVWYVTIDGLWQDEAVAPGVTPVHSYYHHAILVLDVFTGDEIHHILTP